MITDLLGTPSLDDVYHITSPSSVKKLLTQSKPAALAKLYQLAPNTSHGAVHLLSQMLIFNPVSLERGSAGQFRATFNTGGLSVVARSFPISQFVLAGCSKLAPSLVTCFNGPAYGMGA